MVSFHKMAEVVAVKLQVGFKPAGIIHCSTVASREIGPIYTRWIIRLERTCILIGQATKARLIIRLCINTGKQTNHPSRRAIWFLFG